MRLLPALAVAGALGACSFPMASLAPDPAETTGSVKRIEGSPLSPALDAEDWRRARAAMGLALDPQGPGSPVNWDNPDSGRRGTITPTGKPYVKANDICREFESRIVLKDGVRVSAGTACRLHGDEWAVRRLGAATPRP